MMEGTRKWWGSEPEDGGATSEEVYIFDFTLAALEASGRVTWPIQASSDDGAIFELLAQIGCSMPKKEQSA